MNELQPVPRNMMATSQPPTIDVIPSTVSVDFTGFGPKREYAGLLEYWQMVRRHKGAMILVTVCGGLLGFLVTLSSPRVYQARTTLEIQGLNDEFLNMKNMSPV